MCANSASAMRSSFQLSESPSRRRKSIDLCQRVALVAGDALSRGIADVLDQALHERKAATETHAATTDVVKLDAAISSLRKIEERIAEIRQRVWAGDSDAPAEPEPEPLPMATTPPAEE